ncbi:MAG: nucleotidyltransferase domain-containing protein [bacterium]
MTGKLTEIEEKAVKEFKEAVLRKFPGKIKTILLYGSKARGDFHKESDIDVMVLIDEGDFEIRDQILDIAYGFFLKYEVLVSPRVINLKEYQQLTLWQTSFIKNTQRDGISIG